MSRSVVSDTARSALSDLLLSHSFLPSGTSDCDNLAHHFQKFSRNFGVTHRVLNVFVAEVRLNGPPIMPPLIG